MVIGHIRAYSGIFGHPLAEWCENLGKGEKKSNMESNTYLPTYLPTLLTYLTYLPTYLPYLTFPTYLLTFSRIP